VGKGVRETKCRDHKIPCWTGGGFEFFKKKDEEGGEKGWGVVVSSKKTTARVGGLTDNDPKRFPGEKKALLKTKKKNALFPSLVGVWGGECWWVKGASLNSRWSMVG